MNYHYAQIYFDYYFDLNDDLQTKRHHIPIYIERESLHAVRFVGSDNYHYHYDQVCDWL